MTPGGWTGPTRSTATRSKCVFARCSGWRFFFTRLRFSFCRMQTAQRLKSPNCDDPVCAFLAWVIFSFRIFLVLDLEIFNYPYGWLTTLLFSVSVSDFPSVALPSAASSSDSVIERWSDAGSQASETDSQSYKDFGYSSVSDFYSETLLLSSVTSTYFST